MTREVTREELKEVLERHQHWLNIDCDGWESMRADLSDADLVMANLCWTDLRGVDLCEANLRGADLREANLRGADLCEANLRGANLRGADLREANLRGADLCEANLFGADLRGAKNVPYIPLVCPDTGAFIGWKKCRAVDDCCRELIVKLLIPGDAQRTSATTRKCRCDKAVVLEVQELDGTPVDAVARSMTLAYKILDYRTGETVTPEKPFEEDRWQECASGIHFFINRQEAVDYR